MRRTRAWLAGACGIAAVVLAAFPWSPSATGTAGAGMPGDTRPPALTDVRMHVPPFDAVTPRRQEVLAMLDLGDDLQRRETASGTSLPTPPRQDRRRDGGDDWLEQASGDRTEESAATPRWGWLADAVHESRQRPLRVADPSTASDLSDPMDETPWDGWTQEEREFTTTPVTGADAGPAAVRNAEPERFRLFGDLSPSLESPSSTPSAPVPPPERPVESRLEESWLNWPR